MGKEQWKLTKRRQLFGNIYEGPGMITEGKQVVASSTNKLGRAQIVKMKTEIGEHQTIKMRPC